MSFPLMILSKLTKSVTYLYRPQKHQKLSNWFVKKGITIKSKEKSVWL